MEKISIIVPVFNTESKFLKRCLESLLNQTYQEIEIIVVNDGSTNLDTIKILKKYGRMYKRIKIINKKNSGVADSRNKGIENASGEYVMFVDSDDWISNNTCSAVIRFLKSNNLDVVIYGYIFNGDNTSKNKIKTTLIRDMQLDELKKDILSFTTSKYSVCVDSPWGKIFRKKIIDENKISFPKVLSRSEDAIFCLYYYENVKEIGILNGIFYHYSTIDSSLTRKYSFNSVTMLPKILEEQKKYIDRYHFKDKTYYIANKKRVISGILEAEDIYFFNKKNINKYSSEYKLFHDFVRQPLIYQALKDISLSEQEGIWKKIWLITMRTPLIRVYFTIKYFKKVIKIKKGLGHDKCLKEK